MGQILATFPLFERLPLEDRASMAGLLLATLDCLAFDEGGKGPDPEVLAAYDRMSAHELFLRFKLSKRLVNDFVKPTLLVGLFKPPEELSALVVMELLYYYALAHQDSFDVRWIRRGTVSSSLIAPLASDLESNYPLTVLGGTFVTEIADEDGDEGNQKASSRRFSAGDAAKVVRYKQGGWGSSGTEGSIQGVSGVVLALGAKGMKAVVSGSPLLAQHAPFGKAASLQGIDVLSCRLWLDRVVPTRTPANVFSRFPELRGAGGTFFMLDQLQVQSEEDDAFLWGEDVVSADAGGGGESEEEEASSGGTPSPQEEEEIGAEEGAEDGAAAGEGEEEGGAAEGGAAAAVPWAGPRGSVVACDFYNAGALLGLSDADVVKLCAETLLPKAVPEFADAAVVDSWAAKFPGAVSWFSPGSFELRPKLHGAGRADLPNVKCAGDWVRLGEREHGAKGLCQERAFVSGLEAANALLEDMDGGAHKGKAKHEVLPVREDEPQVKAGMAAARKLPKPLRYWVR